MLRGGVSCVSSQNVLISRVGCYVWCLEGCFFFVCSFLVKKDYEVNAENKLKLVRLPNYVK